MLALGMILSFAGYGIAWTGHLWNKGYNLSFKEIWWPGAYTGTWPPPIAPDTVIIPTGTGSAPTASGSGISPSLKRAEGELGSSPNKVGIIK